MAAPETFVAALIAVAVFSAMLRLIRLRRSWPMWLLAGLTAASGALLYCALFPPMLPIGGETILVATAETPASTRAQPGERLIALPEAPSIEGAERVPDLATALRRHAQAQRLRILGRGLTARDRDNAAGRPAAFSPMPLPRGLIRLDPPADTTAGSAFALAGEAAGLEGGSAELLDPAGRRVDRRVIGRDGMFTLGSTARTEGLARFTLRLRGRDKAIVSDTPVPLRTLAQRPFRALLIGAPSPEAKYLRRWAEDAGIALQSRLDAGGGIDLEDEGVRLDAASLREADVVIIDDLTLAGIGNGGRATLAQAVAGGLGVIVRMTGPATGSTRDAWRALGLSVSGGTEIVPVALSPLAADQEALAFRRGPSSADIPEDLNTIDDPTADLGNWRLQTGPDFVPVVADADGVVLSGWQSRGRGRVALWAVANSFALVLNGEADRYGQWWSDTISAVSRPDSVFRPTLPPLVEVDERIAVCRIAASTRVIAPDRTAVALSIDPAAGARGCAAFWPAMEGVHTIIEEGRSDEHTFAFLVLPKQALKTIRANEIGEATMRWSAAQTAPVAFDAPERRGASWPYFLAWLLISATLWFAERRVRAMH